jgi:hypothetical protein
MHTEYLVKSGMWDGTRRAIHVCIIVESDPMAFPSHHVGSAHSTQQDSNSDRRLGRWFCVGHSVSFARNRGGGLISKYDGGAVKDFVVGCLTGLAASIFPYLMGIGESHRFD